MGPTTIKRLATLIAVILVAGLSVFFLQRYQISRMAGSVLRDAEQAATSGDYEKAIAKYQERLDVVPDDEDTKLKLADALQKGPRRPGRWEQAAQIYVEMLNRHPETTDVRRRLAELALRLGLFNPPDRATSTAMYARPNVETLMKMPEAKEDGGLHFLMGRCQEEDHKYREAVESFRTAIAHQAPQQLEAYRRLAVLLGRQLNEAAEADKTIEEMVQSDPKNYQVYLERGRYRRQFVKSEDLKTLKTVRDDYDQALKLGATEPQAFVERAELAVFDVELGREERFIKARQVIEEGLKHAPENVSLHEVLANIELQSGSLDKAIASVRKSLELLPDQAPLHYML